MVTLKRICFSQNPKVRSNHYYVIKFYESHSFTYITCVVCTYEQCFMLIFLLFDGSSLSLTYSVLKVWKKGLHNINFDRLVSQLISEDEECLLFSQRSHPVHPKVSFNVLFDRNSLLHYVMYVYLRKKLHSIFSSSAYCHMRTYML